MTTETERLAAIAATYHTEAMSGIERKYVAATAERIVAASRPGAALQLGCGDGTSTARFLDAFDALHVVDGAADLIAQLPRHPRLSSSVALFEDFEPAARFPSIIMPHVLEHVAEPVALLRRVKGWLAPDGVLTIAVPNAWSLHRHLGVQLGMLPRLDALSEADHRIGHRRVYSPETLRADLEAAGLEVVSLDGIGLKPLSNAQLDALTPQLQDAFVALGGVAPTLANVLLAVAR